MLSNTNSFFILNNHIQSKLNNMNNETKKEENPLFTIARKLHNKQFITWEYDFLHLTPANENTFILGFCGGVNHATTQFAKQIEELQNKIAEMEKHETPTVFLNQPKEDDVKNISQVGEQC